MSYNESSAPRLSRNPLAQRNSNQHSTLTSKKTSTTFNSSFHHVSQSQFQSSKSRKSFDSNLSSSMFKRHKNHPSIKESQPHCSRVE